MALSRDQFRGRTGHQLPIVNFDLLAGNIRWFSGEVVGQGADGIARPLVPGLTPIGVTESSIDYRDYADGEKTITVRSGQAIPLPQDGTIPIGSPIGTPTFWNPTANVLTASDGGGAYAFCGPLVVCRTLTSAEVSFDPNAIKMPGADVMLAKTIAHDDLTAAALTQTIAIGVAPGRFVGGSKLLGANFTGGGATSCTLDVGGTDADGIIAADDVFAGPLAEDFAPPGALVALGFMPSLAGQTINATFTSDVNVSLLTAGSVTLRLFFKQVP